MFLLKERLYRFRDTLVELPRELSHGILRKVKDFVRHKSLQSTRTPIMLQTHHQSCMIRSAH